MHKALAMLLFFLAAAASAKPFVMGTMPDHGSVSFSNGAGSPPALTFIDFSHPANIAGNVSSVSVRWSRTSCTNAFKIKFVRPDSSFGTYTVITERGPITVNDSVMNVAISPAVPVQSGDLLAITQLQPSSCGGVMFTEDDPTAVTLGIDSDIGSGAFFGMTLQHGFTLNARATTVANEPAGILAAVGAVQGVGAFFRTAVQLTNPTSSTMKGKLVYHAQGQPASPSDPSILYSIDPLTVWSRPDILTTMGLSGLGSMDLITTAGGTPRAVVRVFNDRGTDGTDGFVEPLIAPEKAMSNPESDVIVVPADLTNFRVNVGVRSLDDGVRLGIFYTSPNDSAVATPDFVLGANTFSQPSLAVLTSNAPFKVNGLVGIQVKTGAAVIYVSIIDNKTGDSSVYFLGHK